MDNEYVEQQSRSRSRSFICPDCGLGVESIAALTAHLLTHAQLPSPSASCQSPARPPTAHSHAHEQTDSRGDSDAVDVVNHDHEEDFQTDDSVADDVTAQLRHSEVEEEEEEAKCLKTECQPSTPDDALQDGVVRLECPYCHRKDFDSVGPLTSHIRTAHARPSDNLFTCTTCGLAFATVGKLQHHQQVEHSSLPLPQAVTVTLNRPGQATSSSSSSSSSQMTEARWMCRFCPVQFYDSQTQQDHEESIHLNRNSSVVPSLLSQLSPPSSFVFCSQCSLGFPHIYALADHMHHSHGYNARTRASSHDLAPGTSTSSPARRSRDPIRPTALRAADCRPVSSTVPTCCECSITFDSDDQLESHVTSAHYLSLATEYGCTSCLKLFARPEDLQKHLMDVHAHHLYRCTLCKQVFDSKVCVLCCIELLSCEAMQSQSFGS